MRFDRKTLFLILVGVGTVIVVTWALLVLMSRGSGNGEEGDVFDISITDQIFGRRSEVQDDFSFGSASTRPNALVQISKGPIAGAIVHGTLGAGTTTSGTGTTTEAQEVYVRTVSYVEKKTGHIFSYSTETGENERISNTLIPGIENVSWVSSDRVGLKTYNSGELYLGKISDGELDGRFLDRDVLRIIPMSTTTMGVLSLNGNGTLVQETTLTETPLRDIARSPLKDVSVAAVKRGLVVLFSNPSAKLDGVAHLYEVGKEPLRIAGGTGLTVLADDSGDWFLVGLGVRKQMTLSLFERKSSRLIPLSIATLPEKCVWASQKPFALCAIPISPPSTLYPDDWYQGAVSFNDELWAIDAEKGQARLIRAFTDKEGLFDIINLSIDERGTYLTFINKKDQSLWGLEL